MNLMWMTCFFSIWVDLPSDTNHRVKEWVFQAEVYERRDEAIMALENMLQGVGGKESRTEIVHALSVVKHGRPRDLEIPAIDPDRLGFPDAVLVNKGLAWLLVDETWLSLGDWAGRYYLADITLEGVTLARPGGFLMEIPLTLTTAMVPEGDHAILNNAALREVLTFVSRREGLNSFVPSEIEQRVSGLFEIDNWLGLLDRLCAGTEVTWTRRRENMIFSSRSMPQSLSAARIARVDRRDAYLGNFLQNLAASFEMELVLDERLSDTRVDIQLQDQPWDEVLDCLSIMNGFTWFLAREPREKPRLIIQKE